MTAELFEEEEITTNSPNPTNRGNFRHGDRRQSCSDSKFVCFCREEW